MIDRIRHFLREKIARGSLAWRIAVGALYAVRYASVLAHYGALKGRHGLEIGGPSRNFRDGVLPVYPLVASLDGCNFASETVWEGRIEEGWTYKYHPRRKAGRQYICDATDLGVIPAGSYDLILTSHVIEHIANPIKALREWIRVLKTGGILLLVAPHRDGADEAPRPTTTLEHLVDDFRRGAGEDELTHLQETLNWMDSRPGVPEAEKEAFRKHISDNYNTRGLHHHVFDTNLAAALIDHAGMQILSVRPLPPCHIVIMAEKAAAPEKIDNAAFLGPHAGYRRKSPFPSDRTGL